MDKQAFKNTIRSRLVPTRRLFTISLLVVALTLIAVWLLGLEKHRTLFLNSLLSVTVLSAFFFGYIAYGLYRGIKLKDNMGKVTDKFKFRSFDRLGNGLGGFDIPVADGIAGILIGIVLWIVVTIVLLFLLWLLGNALWMLILAFVAMLYWVFFRALRLIFRKSPVCRGNLARSAAYGFFYTLLYNSWIYGIIMTAHYLIH